MWSKVTKEEKDSIISMYDNKMLIRDIMRKTGRSERTIYNIINEEEAQGRRIKSFEHLEQLKHMYYAGTTLEMIGLEFGISRQRVHQLLKSNNVPLRSRATMPSHPTPVKEVELTNNEVENCVNGKAHHWNIEEPTGQISIGICKHCNQTKQFKNYVHSNSTTILMKNSRQARTYNELEDYV